MKGCTLTNNDSWEPGGAGYFWGSSLHIENSAVIGNEACFYGGGICCDSATIVSSLFSQNSAHVGDIFDGLGGGVFCGRASITDCIFSGNSACFLGGGLVCGDAVIEDCVFSGNLSSCGGGAVACMEPAQFTNCTFFGNDAASVVYFGDYCGDRGLGHYSPLEAGGSDPLSIAHQSDPGPAFENCIIAFNLASEPVSCSPYGGTEVPVVTCCDIYGNANGDWVGCIADQFGVSGNISADPMFCNPDSGDLHLDVNSPCAPQGEGTCGLMGALGPACEHTPPDLALGVLQNPYLTQYLDIYLVSSEELDSTSVVVQVGIDTIEVHLVDDIEHVWKGDYKLTGSADSISIQACASGTWGNEACTTMWFGARFVLAAQGGSAVSADGRLYLMLDPGALGRDSFILILPGGDEWSPGGGLRCSHGQSLAPCLDRDGEWPSYCISPPGVLAGRGCSLVFRYDASDLAGEAHDRLYIEKLNEGPLESFVDPTGGTVAAPISEFGTFRLALGPRGSSREVDSRFLKLEHNAPNPFTSVTTVRFEIRCRQQVAVTVYDVSGRRVARLLDEVVHPGCHEVLWDGTTERGRHAAAGLYFCRVQIERRTSTRKMLLVR